MADTQHRQPEARVHVDTIWTDGSQWHSDAIYYLDQAVKAFAEQEAQRRGIKLSPL